jgi:endoglucanase
MKFNFKIPFCIALLLFVGVRCGTEEVSPEDRNISQNANARTSIAAVGAASIAGVNWADGRDNFVDGWVIPSGLASSDNYTTISAKANSILAGFQTNMPGVNTVRLPINPPSVLEAWWGAYNGAVDRAISRNMNVILACWESASSRNGLIDNATAFWQMWDVVIAKYGTNSRVFFEVFNEPHGYSLTDLTNIYAQFLSRYPNVSRGRIILGGTGYSENVTAVGADSRFSSCLLALHNYAFWNTSRTTVAAWEQDWRSRFGSYASRTVVTEYGATMTNGKNYTGAANNDHEIAYIQGATNVFRTDKVASVYWPGLRDGDSYAAQTRGGSGTNITLTTTNATGVQRIRYGWGENVSGAGSGGSFNSSAYYRVINRNSNLVLDVIGGSTANGAQVIQGTWNGGNNQQWQIIDNGGGYYRIINRNSAHALDVNAGSTANGANVIQWPWNGGNNQQWQIIDNGGGYYRIINRNSGQALDVSGGSTANGTNVIQWPWSGGNNQQWQVIQQ